MDIKEFLDLNAGKWFSQRTNYLTGDKAQSGKADLTVELLASDNSTIVNLCQNERIDPQHSLGGLSTSWDSSVDWGKPKQIGSVVMVFIADDSSDRTGKVLRQENGKAQGSYTLGDDGALTVVVETDSIIAEERQWFASDNLRLRTTVVTDKVTKAIVQTSFYSEIRKAPAK
ncbi:phycobiliprotein lyase [Myxosarcina sp. GI1]|uniref:phycobiliprotein lyase n=1 Tax=Myxosarcina sp. GI1 TaxID=1541065 RepID=UPI00055CCDA1|nr:phycobiliprotein lyase [Myxosarcina sp. GI1]